MKTEIATSSQFTIGGNMDINDVLTVATSRAETKFQTELGAARKVLRDAEGELTKANTTLVKAIETQAEELGETHATMVRDGVKVMGGVLEIVANKGLDDKGNVIATVNIKATGGYNGVTFTMREKPQYAVLSATEKRDQAQEIKTRAEETAMEWKKKLNNIPTLERKMKAKLAEAKLRDSVEGLAMLDALTDGLDNEMLALPGY